MMSEKTRGTNDVTDFSLIINTATNSTELAGVNLLTPGEGFWNSIRGLRNQGI